MKSQDFKINIKTVWILVISNVLLTLVAMFSKLSHFEFSQVMLTVGVMLFFASWIIILTDMIKNNIYNKSFWVTSMFFVPPISQIIYLIQRNKLILK